MYVYTYAGMFRLILHMTKDCNGLKLNFHKISRILCTDMPYFSSPGHNFMQKTSYGAQQVGMHS